MLTKIDLCSMALLKIGEQPIQSWLQDTATAGLCRTLFDTVIDSLLSMHPWRFACREYTLIRDADGNLILPRECLRVLKCPHDIVGNRVISDAETVTILAITRVTPDAFPSYFTSLAATRLAMEFCIPLTGDQTVFRMLTALYESELQSAKFIDSTASASPDITNFSLISTRF